VGRIDLVLRSLGFDSGQRGVVAMVLNASSHDHYDVE